LLLVILGLKHIDEYLGSAARPDLALKRQHDPSSS